MAQNLWRLTRYVYQSTIDASFFFTCFLCVRVNVCVQATIRMYNYQVGVQRVFFSFAPRVKSVVENSALLSEAATVLARSSPVDVFDVRLRIYALSAIVVPESRNRQWQPIRFARWLSTLFNEFRNWDDCYQLFCHFYLKFAIGLKGSLLFALFSCNIDCPISKLYGKNT